MVRVNIITTNPHIKRPKVVTLSTPVSPMRRKISSALAGGAAGLALGHECGSGLGIAGYGTGYKATPFFSIVGLLIGLGLGYMVADVSA